jgi:hypothetical protein
LPASKNRKTLVLHKSVGEDRIVGSDCSSSRLVLKPLVSDLPVSSQELSPSTSPRIVSPSTSLISRPMSYHQPRNGGRARTHPRAPRDYVRADPYYPPPQRQDNYRPASSPPPIDDRFGPPRRRDRSRSPGEYRDGRGFYDRQDASAYSSRDHGRQWGRPAADTPIDVRMPEDGRRWGYYDPPLRERDVPPPRDWQPRDGDRDRDRDRAYDRPREYSSYDHRHGERPRGYGACAFLRYTSHLGLGSLF